MKSALSPEKNTILKKEGGTIITIKFLVFFVTVGEGQNRW